MLIKRPDDVRSSELTDEKLYWNRRRFIRAAGAAAVGLGVGAWLVDHRGHPVNAEQAAWKPSKPSPYDTSEGLTSLEDVTTYNNFYEFGTGKDDPARLAASFKPRPWAIHIDGEVARPGRYTLEDILKPVTLEDRIYRMRCVEGWSMVIPWRGFPLSALLKRVEPTSRARFVEFTTVMRPDELPGQRRAVLDWPYKEGLRLDEAMHPLTILATGLYGKDLPNQNGAPLRLVVPWKYGFKSAKSIARIRLMEYPPETSWAKSNPREYGFYSNVNPEVDHPRWGQARERRIGEYSRRATLMFNGYADQVASLYKGMDLRANF